MMKILVVVFCRFWRVASHAVQSLPADKAHPGTDKKQHEAVTFRVVASPVPIPTRPPIVA